MQGHTDIEVDKAALKVQWPKPPSSQPAEQPQHLQQAESQGLHLCPYGGESSFDVQERLAHWVEQLAAASSDSR